ncbi:MAG TPA: hypothetical protein VHN59_06230 [Chitinophagaceae bacterium]|nr:hypothetical protein [Chitinophagaceae bacterium]
MSIGLVGFFAVFVGFGKTLPPAIRDERTPISIYIHGAFAFCWLCLFFIQATLIRYNNFRLHKALGIFGAFIAIGTALTMLPAGVYQVQKDLDKGLGEASYSNIVGVVTNATIFLAIVIAGILNRKNPPVHKRLMLLATILVLWVAWFRFRHYFPSVPRPDIWFGLVLSNSLIIVSWIWDRSVNGRLHPVLGWVGAFIIAEQTFEVIMFDSPAWRLVGKGIFDLLAIK